MKIINLDGFKVERKITLGGIEYEVYGMAVGDFIGGDVNEDNPGEEKTTTQKISAMLDTIVSKTSMPREVVEKQSFPVIRAILAVIYGNDPVAQAEKEDGTKGQ